MWAYPIVISSMVTLIALISRQSNVDFGNQKRANHLGKVTKTIANETRGSKEALLA